MDEPAGEYWYGTVPETGLTVLFEPEEPSLDIVFIHGFTGHPERTWATKKGNTRHRSDDCVADEFAEPLHKVRKLNPFSSSHHNKRDIASALCWPRDLVPTTIPNARVLTYGYDTRIRHWIGSPVNRNTVYDIAWDLLVALESERRIIPSRPILFIAHSLGGIVVKEMLRRSKGCGMGQIHLRSVFESTIGIMFFGTPHAGADPRGFLQHIAEKVIKAAGFSVNEQIVNTLLPSSERLRELRDEFGPMAQEQKWIIHSFQEQLGVKILNGQKVVEDISSYLNVPAVEITEHIGRDHMEMCRFMGPDDIEYKKVAAALCRMGVVTPKQPTNHMMPSLKEEQKQELLDSLRFDQIDARRMTIKKAHAKTCKWLLRKSEYLDWFDLSKLSEHHGVLWIKGKPGAGKSTLMKFIFATAQREMRDKIIISFFFNARGENLEKSTIGMYRSLLLQLLERLPRLQDVFYSLGLTTLNDGCHQWSIEALKALFEQAVQDLGNLPLVCFIDALDECDEQEIREMISFFEHVGELAASSGIPFQVCFSSRHYPYITIKKGINLILEGQEEHDQDMVSYLNSELKIGHSKTAEKIRADIKDKAAGVFMWVVLVIQILNKEYDRGRIHALRQRLHEIPGDLHELFRNILTRDRDNQDELLLCIQWVLFARQPLQPVQLYFAILSGIEAENLSDIEPDEITSAATERFILDCSKGLAEITKSKKPTVQFIHESVKDFLVKENGLKEICSDLGSQFEGESHERLKQCCLNYMSIDMSAYIDIDDSIPKASSPEAAALRQSVDKALPFIEYATHNILYHADAAEGGGVEQMHFLQTFKVADWIKLNNLFEKHQIRRHTLNASLLYILAENNMGNLIKIHPSKVACFKIEDERYGLPIFAALATNSSEAVQAFIRAQAEAIPSISPLYSLCKQYCYNGKVRTDFGRDFSFSRQKSILSYLAKQSDEMLFLASAFTLVYSDTNSMDNSYQIPSLPWTVHSSLEGVAEMLVEENPSLEYKNNDGKTPLFWATQEGYDVVARLLLKKGADIESKDMSGQSMLLWAVSYGHEMIFKLLLERGADIESKDNGGRSPLYMAVINQHETILKLLLERGADIESKDNKGRSPLLRAIIYGNGTAVKLLLEKGADIESKDSNSDGPLSLAVTHGHESIVKLLLEKGANVDPKNNDGRTPLSQAAGWGRIELMEILLDKGADVDSKDHAGITSLWWAIVKDVSLAIGLLLERGAAIDIEVEDGLAPLAWASGRRKWSVVEILLKFTTDVDCKSKDGRTPLSWAAEEAKEKLVEMLLERGADPAVGDKHGKTPLSYAMDGLRENPRLKEGYEKVIELLMR